MKITFLGSGGAFSLAKENYHSNILLEEDGANFLYDCGSTIGEALNDKGLEPKDIDSIYISHLHGDHCGGIEYMAFKTYFGQFPFGVQKINLFGHHSILQDGWMHSWSGGLKCIQGKELELEDYFHTSYMELEDDMYFCGHKLQPVKTLHVKVDETDEGEVPSFGLSISTLEGKKIFISGDTQFDKENLMKYWLESNLIFNEVEFADYPNSVHTQYKDLLTLEDNIRKKMYLYHYSLNGKTFKELNEQVQKDGFKGLVQRGQEFSLD